MGEVLPPSGQELSDSFVAVFGQNKEDLTKCQLLTVSRHEYKTLAEERCQVNANFGRTVIDRQRVEALPERGVPQQFIECAVQMPEVERYSATRAGPGTIRDPLEAGQPDDDGSDELSDESGEECAAEDKTAHASCSDEHPAGQKSEPQLNQFETCLGIDATAAPDFATHCRLQSPAGLGAGDAEKTAARRIPTSTVLHSLATQRLTVLLTLPRPQLKRNAFVL